MRFSDPRQASGHSSERRLAYATRWAAEHDLLLDESLRMRDEGLSTYHQRHVKSGALKVFPGAVEQGHIPVGSVLVVEGLDRLSRAEPIQAQAQLTQIVNAGITVVTASDEKTYSREHLKANPMNLVYSLLVMMRAHEESDTESKRVLTRIRRHQRERLRLYLVGYGTTKILERSAQQIQDKAESLKDRLDAFFALLEHLGSASCARQPYRTNGAPMYRHARRGNTDAKRRRLSQSA